METLTEHDKDLIEVLRYKHFMPVKEISEKFEVPPKQIRAMLEQRSTWRIAYLNTQGRAR